MSSLSRPVPLWSLILVLVALGASLAAGFTVGSQLTNLLGSKPGDFTLASGSNPFSVQQGSSSNTTLSVKSVNGLGGGLDVSATLSTNATAWITATPNPTVVRLDPGQVATATIIVAAKYGAPLGNYPFTAHVSSGALSRDLAFAVTITPASDFTLLVTPTNHTLTVFQGSANSATVSLTSVNGLGGSLGITASLSNNATGWITATPSPSVVNFGSGSTTTSSVTIAARYSTLVGSYPVTVFASNGVQSHSLTFNAIIVSAPDFNITASPASLRVAQGSSNATAIYLASLHSFFGSVSLSATSPLVLLGVAGTGSPVRLVVNGSNSTAMAVSTSNLTPLGIYTINVTGTSGAISHRIIVTVVVVPPSAPRESLLMNNYAFGSNTNVTLSLKNIGASNITFVAYYVKDAAGDQYSNTVWSGPTILPNMTMAVNMLIGASCGSCTLAGSPFTFTAGNQYTITIVTARNNQFTFTVAR